MPTCGDGLIGRDAGLCDGVSWDTVRDASSQRCLLMANHQSKIPISIQRVRNTKPHPLMYLSFLPMFGWLKLCLQVHLSKASTTSHTPFDGAALAATRSPVIALFWCLIKFTTTTTCTSTCLPTVSLTLHVRVFLSACRDPFQ